MLHPYPSWRKLKKTEINTYAFISKKSTLDAFVYLQGITVVQIVKQRDTYQKKLTNWYFWQKYHLITFFLIDQIFSNVDIILINLFYSPVKF